MPKAFKDFSNQELFSLISFGALIGWVVSLPYEGPALYALLMESPVEVFITNSSSLFCLAAGMITGVFIKLPPRRVIRSIAGLGIFCLLTSLWFPVISPEYITYILPFTSFGAGLAITLHGHMLRYGVSKKNWSSIAAPCMLLATAILIISHLLTNFISAHLGFIWAELALLLSIIACLKKERLHFIPHKTASYDLSAIIKKFWLFLLFIFLVSTMAGVMFQVIYPVFADFPYLTAFYTNLPYLAAILFFSWLHKNSKFSMLYTSLSLWGVGLLAFSHLEPSSASFLLIFTAILFAAGTFDLFWWTVFTTSFHYVKNPATMVGLVLAANVFGSFTGGFASNYLAGFGTSQETITQMSLLVVFACMVLIIPLNRMISHLLPNNPFLETPGWQPEYYSALAAAKKLSSRELEVFDLLLEGKTDKEISNQLGISLHTVKTHNRKVYTKLEVKNRYELKKAFSPT